MLRGFHTCVDCQTHVLTSAQHNQLHQPRRKPSLVFSHSAHFKDRAEKHNVEHGKTTSDFLLLRTRGWDQLLDM